MAIGCSFWHKILCVPVLNTSLIVVKGMLVISLARIGLYGVTHVLERNMR